MSLIPCRDTYILYSARCNLVSHCNGYACVKSSIGSQSILKIYLYLKIIKYVMVRSFTLLHLIFSESQGKNWSLEEKSLWSFK